MQAYSTASGGVMYVEDTIKRSKTAKNPYAGSKSYNQILSETGETQEKYLPKLSTPEKVA